MTPAAGRTAKLRTKEQVVFRGPPDRLAALLPAPAVAKARAAGEPAASLRGAEVRGLTVRTLARAGVDARRATLRLPRTTPPGTYRGSAEIEGRKVAIVAEVERRPRLEADPRRIVVEVAPGATATVSLTLLNTGNVPCDVSGATPVLPLRRTRPRARLLAGAHLRPPEGQAARSTCSWTTSRRPTAGSSRPGSRGARRWRLERHVR